MKPIRIAFDLDGTLYDPATDQPIEKVLNLFIALGKFSSVQLAVWSGLGKSACEKFVEKYNLQQYSENKILIGDKVFIEDISPDIVVDDTKIYIDIFPSIIV